MKLIFKIKLHPFFLLLAFLCMMMGLFKEFLLFMTIIVLHEAGHIIMGLLLKEKIEKVIILPFGGLTLFRMPLNETTNKELLIAMSGPIAQILSFCLLRKVINSPAFTYYNIGLLLFNLLPIYPLDGSKILNSLCNKVLCFKVSFYITMMISLLFLFVFSFYLLFFKPNLMLLLAFFFFFWKTYLEIRKYPHLYNKFLWERLNNNYSFHKISYIKSLYHMYKDRRHMIKDGIWKTEKEILRKRFDFK